MLIRYIEGGNPLDTAFTHSALFKGHDFLYKYVNTDKVVAIDPGTNKMGIVFSEADELKPCFILEVSRANNIETSSDLFINKATEYLNYFYTYLPVKQTVIEGQFRQKFNYSTDVVGALAKSLTGVAKSHGSRVVKFYPAEWKSTFLAPYKEKYKLNLTKSNKKHVAIRCRELYPAMRAFGEESDTFDAFGMIHHYFENLAIKGDQIIITDRMKPDFNHQILEILAPLNQQENHQLVENVTQYFANKEGKTRPLVQAEFNSSLSIPENMRSCTTNSNAIFVAAIQPKIIYMPYLYQNKYARATNQPIQTLKLPKLTPETPLFLIFARQDYLQSLE